MKLRMFLTATFLLAAACAPGNVRLTHQEINSAYSAGGFAYASAGRDLRVVIHGNPFGGGNTAFRKSVTDAMQGRNWGQKTNFTTTPGESARKVYKVVLLFDPPVDFLARKLCGADDTTLAAMPTPGDGVNVFAAFCLGDKSLTEVKGYTAQATNPGDPAFRELVGQVTGALFPPVRRGDDQDRCRKRPLCN